MQSQHFIDGQWTATDRWTDSLDPANGELIGCFADGGEAEAEAAVAAAARAFNDPQWAQNPRLRQQLLLEWAAGLTARQEQLAQLLTRENGKALERSAGRFPRFFITPAWPGTTRGTCSKWRPVSSPACCANPPEWRG